MFTHTGEGNGPTDTSPEDDEERTSDGSGDFFTVMLNPVALIGNANA